MVLNEITKGMSNAAEQIDGNFKKIDPMIDDTGYLPLNYINGYKGNSVATGTYRKVGKMVEIIFNVTNLQIVSNSVNDTFAILPSGFRPPKGFSFFARTNGTTGKNPMKCTVEVSGELKIVSNGDNSVKIDEWASAQQMFFVE